MATIASSVEVLLSSASSDSDVDESYYYNGGNGSGVGCMNPNIGLNTRVNIHGILTNPLLPLNVTHVLQVCFETWVLDAHHKADIRQMQLSSRGLLHTLAQMVRMERDDPHYFQHLSAHQQRERWNTKQAFQDELNTLLATTRKSCSRFDRWMGLRCDRIEACLGALTQWERGAVDYHRRAIFGLEYIHREEYI